MAKTQRWTPEDILRTLVEAEIAARDASNTANRLKTAAFPVTKTLDGFDVTESSIPQATFDYLSAWNGCRRNRIWRLSVRPAQAKVHLSSAAGTPPCTPVTRSAISPPPTSSRCSTGAWPTTPSARSSTHYCGTTSF